MCPLDDSDNNFLELNCVQGKIFKYILQSNIEINKDRIINPFVYYENIQYLNLVRLHTHLNRILQINNVNDKNTLKIDNEIMNEIKIMKTKNR